LADFDEAFVDYLLGCPGIASLIERWIFPDYFPQSEQLPAMAYTLEDNSSQQTLQGPSCMREAIYQINIWNYYFRRRSRQLSRTGYPYRRLRHKAVPSIKQKLSDKAKVWKLFVHIVATFGKIRHRAGINGKTGIKRDEGSYITLIRSLWGIWVGWFMTEPAYSDYPSPAPDCDKLIGN
jgi:hypothetical protein